MTEDILSLQFFWLKGQECSVTVIKVSSHTKPLLGKSILCKTYGLKTKLCNRSHYMRNVTTAEVIIDKF